MKVIIAKIRTFLKGLSFRTGVIVLIACGISYTISFMQALLPLPPAVKVSLWVIFFGLAKALQYTGLLILGKEGWKRLRNKLRKEKIPTAE